MLSLFLRAKSAHELAPMALLLVNGSGRNIGGMQGQAWLLQLSSLAGVLVLNS
jgi:hypothetical protein